MKTEERPRKAAKDKETLRQRKAREDKKRLYLLSGLLRQSEGYMSPGWWLR